MCGVAVIYSAARAIPPGRIDQMVTSLVHRGPDEQGLVRTPQCHLGHRRLCIIDPTGGGQPMWDESERWCLTFNGEIYNYRELRRELESLGVRFRTKSDTEVLLLAYRQWGQSVLSRLNGQFAFVIWDQFEKCLFAARDRLGEKPLYWARSPSGEFLLASEIRAIIAAGMIRPVIDESSVDTFLHLMYVPPRQTIYQNVHTLGPGQALTIRDGKLHSWSYWEPKLSTDPIDPVEAAQETRKLLERAVARQMVADTTVGAFLSGGLDSTTIVALMTHNTNLPIQTFAAGFGDVIDELPFARAVATQYSTDHHELQVDILVIETLQRMAEVYDEPFGDSSNIPTFLLAGFARQHVKVVLSGDGSDELFGGYAWYSPLMSHDIRSGSLAKLVWLQVACKTAGVLGGLGASLGDWRERMKREYHEIRAKRRHPDLWQRHLSALAVQSRQQRDQLWERTSSNERAESLLAQNYEPDDSVAGLDRAVDFDLRCYLAGDIFVKVDRAAMSHGLETRSPFMDVELVEFVLSVPWRMRFRGGPTKSLLRDACQDLWPEVVRKRGKQGFGAPLANWLNRADMRAVTDRLFRPGSYLTDLLPGVVKQRRHLSRRPQACWNLLCLGLWLEKQSGCAQLKLAS